MWRRHGFFWNGLRADDRVRHLFLDIPLLASPAKVPPQRVSGESGSGAQKNAQGLRGASRRRGAAVAMVRMRRECKEEGKEERTAAPH